MQELSDACRQYVEVRTAGQQEDEPRNDIEPKFVRSTEKLQRLIAERTHLVENAIRAEHIYLKDREYVVRNGEIILVDEFTGRLMEGTTIF